MKDVYAVLSSKGVHDRSRSAVRIGIAFENKDGSTTIFLDALPLSGCLVVRERGLAAPIEDKKGGQPDVRAQTRP